AGAVPGAVLDGSALRRGAATGPSGGALADHDLGVRVPGREGGSGKTRQRDLRGAIRRGGAGRGVLLRVVRRAAAQRGAVGRGLTARGATVRGRARRGSVRRRGARRGAVGRRPAG